jgi:hypothetical protein
MALGLLVGSDSGCVRVAARRAPFYAGAGDAALRL